MKRLLTRVPGPSAAAVVTREKGPLVIFQSSFLPQIDRTSALGFGTNRSMAVESPAERECMFSKLLEAGVNHFNTAPFTDTAPPSASASSSVFPTSGSSNPTLTLVALTLRLADRLKSLL